MRDRNIRYFPQVWPLIMEQFRRDQTSPRTEIQLQVPCGTFSTAIQPPYNHHTTTMQSTKDGTPSPNNTAPHCLSMQSAEPADHGQCFAGDRVRRHPCPHEGQEECATRKPSREVAKALTHVPRPSLQGLKQKKYENAKSGEAQRHKREQARLDVIATR